MRKECSNCGEHKELHLFEKDRRNTDGHGSRCLECKNKASAITKRLRAQGIYQHAPPRKAKDPSQVHLEPEDKDLELKRRARNWLKQYGESAYAKARLL